MSLSYVTRPHIAIGTSHSVFAMKKKMYYKSANNFKTVHYLQRQRHRYKKEQYKKKKREKKENGNQF